MGAAEEGQFLLGPEKYWNAVDLAVVSSSLVEIAMAQWSANPSALRLLRLLKLVRSARTVRLMRFTPFVHDLRFMVLACINSVSALFWASVVLLLFLYIFSLAFVNGLSEYVEGASTENQHIEEIERFFQSMPMTMLTLFLSITGGLDWWAVAEVLMDVSYSMLSLFLLYILLALLAILNVITSIFVSDAIEVAHQDRDIKMKVQLTKSKKQLDILTEIFSEIDVMRTGHITSDQFQQHMQREEILALFSLFDFTVLDDLAFFNLLDSDQNGLIDLEEFVMGCLRTSGHGTIDMEMSLLETKRLARDSLCQQKVCAGMLKDIDRKLATLSSRSG